MTMTTVSTGSAMYGRSGSKRHAAKMVEITREDGTSYRSVFIICKCSCSTSRGPNKMHSYRADVPGTCGVQA